MKPAIAIISTGTELTTGRSRDSNGPTLASELVDHGFRIYMLEMLPDDPEILSREISSLIERPGLSGLIMTGGMGATDDDHTVSVLERVTGRPAREDPEHLQKLIDRAEKLKGRIRVDAARKQVRVIEGATVLPNQNGIAPGMLLEVSRPDRKPYDADDRSPFLIAAMSGFPQEMFPIFRDSLLPLLKEKLVGSTRTSRESFFIYGINESDLQATMTEELSSHVPPGDFDWGVSAGGGRLKVFLDTGDREFQEALHDRLKMRYKQHYLPNSSELELHELAMARGFKLGFAESCTGGLIGKMVTDQAGSSSYFMGSLVTYSNESKQRLLGVQQATMETYGAVSEQTAKEMALGARRELDADYSVAVTGIAGPGGGTEEKPVGTVYMGLAGPQGDAIAIRIFYPLDRDRIREYTAGLALFYLYQYVLDNKVFND